MQRLFSSISLVFMFWLPLAVALMLLVLALWKGNVGMGILAVVLALITGLYRVIMVGATKGKIRRERP